MHEEDNPLKAIHYELDSYSVAAVLLSNKVPDVAKTNRCMQLIHGKPDPNDIRLLSCATLFQSRDGKTFGGLPLPKEHVAFGEAVAAGFEKVISLAASHFEQRDFIYFLRRLRDLLRAIAPEPTSPLPRPAMLADLFVESLLQNFGGLDAAHFRTEVLGTNAHWHRVKASRLCP
jgi:hypothetical protein